MRKNLFRGVLLGLGVASMLATFPHTAAADANSEEMTSQVKESEQHTRRVSDTEKVEVGWVERIDIYPEKLRFDAKLTPGSEGNVLHAKNIKKFKKGKKTFVRFKVDDKKGKSIQLEREVVDTTRFRTTSGKLEERYQVMLDFCIASKFFHLEFSLADRSNFEHEVRIGRDALAGHFLINPGRIRTTRPQCKRAKVKKKDSVSEES